MKKIISLFLRNYDGDRLVRDEVTPGAEWVSAGHGVATLKLDGTSCMVKDGWLYKRYDAKTSKPPPDGFIAAQEPDLAAGHWYGWVPVGSGPDDKYHREAFSTRLERHDGTYELIGPKVQGNPHEASMHLLIKHGGFVPPSDPPRDFEGLREYFRYAAIEGVVWHHPDGRMVKIKRKDFGFPWPSTDGITAQPVVTEDGGEVWTRMATLSSASDLGTVADALDGLAALDKGRAFLSSSPAESILGVEETRTMDEQITEVVTALENVSLRMATNEPTKQEICDWHHGIMQAIQKLKAYRPIPGGASLLVDGPGTKYDPAK